ncbi:ADP-ribosylglycohydrolase family protein [Guyparkeria hydrothermalis]|uniref:ADP-ribosylglycohydrolase family protein n=1 Tax=Guyparkeria hydrothermalis TaxID=923 RepID=UPI0020214BC4|nr:ADP-ribosylglycohydrolase family protein [Guyparkeria hydrothermalis]MCL7744280.1 ADP-ribosylglycohydrolase family protein [Guyparkeria hydrothermalis]
MAGVMETIPDELRPLQSRFRGCLLGGAVGDALGAPVEFMSRSEIEGAFGPDGITDFAPAYGGVGRITDDTQMTLFTADGLIRAYVRGSTKGIVHAPSVVRYAYSRWLITQGIEPHEDWRPGEDWFGWLDEQRELRHRRAPGNTCITALSRGELRDDIADNNSKGCGGVMRVAPVGLNASLGNEFIEGDDGFRLGCELAAFTHGHPTGFLAAGALAALIANVTKGDDVETALTKARESLRAEPDCGETLDALDQARDLARSDVSRTDAITRLGEGWVAEEALAISVYCALVAHDFRDGVTLAVNHDGDSDSTGAITGNILGARWGLESIPAEWLARLELFQVIIELADDLLSCRSWPVGELGDDWDFDSLVMKKYPPV